MDNSDESIDKLIKILKLIPNKEQTLENFIEQIYIDNINKAQKETEDKIDIEIKQSKTLLQNIKEKL